MTTDPDKLIELVFRTLESEGVTLVNLETISGTPQYYIDIEESKMTKSLDETLRSAYGILWTLTYGKVSESNRNSKIELKYKVRCNKS